MKKILVINADVMAMLLSRAQDPSIEAEIYSGNLSHIEELNPDLVLLWAPHSTHVEGALRDARQVNQKVLIITDRPELFQGSGTEVIENDNAGTIWEAIIPHLN